MASNDGTYEDERGTFIWRTVGGRKIKIYNGQSLSEAMIQSGKFKNLRSDYRKAKEEEKETKPIHKLGQTNEFDETIDLNSKEVRESLQETKRKADEWRKEHGEEPIFTDKEKGIENTREQELKTRYGTDDVDLINAGRESENRVKLKEDNKKETTFTSQSTNPFYEDTTYSKEQLDKMAENKIKPMKNTYSGRGWEGTNYDSKLSTKDIAKNISDYSKKEFPDVKLSRRTDYNSMDINIMSSKQDLYASASDIDKMSDKQVSDTIRDSIGGYTRMDNWLNENNRKTANGTFTAKDERDYLKEELNTYKSRNGNRAVGDEWYLSDYGKKVVSGLNKEMNSYNFDDDDPMTDYFHSNFYGYVNIGKWDKPYEVSTKTTTMNDKIRDEAYRKYMKEHPNSKMTLDDFLKKK